MNSLAFQKDVVHNDGKKPDDFDSSDTISENLKRTKDIAKESTTLVQNLTKLRLLEPGDACTASESWKTRNVNRKQNSGVDWNLCQQRDKGAIRVVYQMTRKKIAERGGLQDILLRDRLKVVACMVQESMREALGQKRCLGIFLKYGEEQKFLRTSDEDVIGPLDRGDWKLFDKILAHMITKLQEDPNLNGKDMFFLQKRINTLKRNLNVFQMARAKAETQISRLQRLLDEVPGPPVAILDQEFQYCTEIAEDAHGTVLGFTKELRKFGWGRVPACPVGHALLHHKMNRHEVGEDQPVFDIVGTTHKAPAPDAQTKSCKRQATKSIAEKASNKAMDTVKGVLGKAQTMKREQSNTDLDGEGQKGGLERKTTTQLPEGGKSRIGAAAAEIGTRGTILKQNAAYLGKLAARGRSQLRTESYVHSDSGFEADGAIAGTCKAMKKKVLCSGCDQKMAVDQKVWKCQRCYPACFICTKCRKGIGIQELSSLTGNVQHESELVWMASIQELLEEPCKGWTETVQDLHGTLMKMKGSKINMAKMISKHNFVLGMLSNDSQKTAVKFGAAEPIWSGKGAAEAIESGGHRKTMSRAPTKEFLRGNAHEEKARRTISGAYNQPLKTALKSPRSKSTFTKTMTFDDKDDSGETPTSAQYRKLIECLEGDDDEGTQSGGSEKSEGSAPVRKSKLEKRHTSRIEVLDDSTSSSESSGSSGSEEWECPGSVGGLWTSRPDGAALRGRKTLEKLDAVSLPTTPKQLQRSRMKRGGLFYHASDGNMLGDILLCNSTGSTGHLQRGWNGGADPLESVRKGRPSMYSPGTSVNVDAFTEDGIGLGGQDSGKVGFKQEPSLGIHVRNQYGGIVEQRSSRKTRRFDENGGYSDEEDVDMSPSNFARQFSDRQSQFCRQLTSRISRASTTASFSSRRLEGRCSDAGSFDLIDSKVGSASMGKQKTLWRRASTKQDMSHDDFAIGDECFVLDEQSGMYKAAVIVSKRSDFDGSDFVSKRTSFDIDLEDGSTLEVQASSLCKMVDPDLILSLSQKISSNPGKSSIAEYYEAQLRRVTEGKVVREIAQASVDLDAERQSLEQKGRKLLELSREPSKQEILVAKWGLDPLPNQAESRRPSVKIRFVDTLGHLFGIHRNDKRRMRTPCTVEDVISTLSTAFHRDHLDNPSGDLQTHGHSNPEVMGTHPPGSVLPAVFDAHKLCRSMNESSDDFAFTPVAPEANPQDVVVVSGRAGDGIKWPKRLRAVKALHRRYNCPQSQVVPQSKSQRARKKGVRPDCWRFPMASQEELKHQQFEDADQLDIKPIEYQESTFLPDATSNSGT